MKPARASEPHGSSRAAPQVDFARAEGSARVLPVGVDSYMRSCAEFQVSAVARVPLRLAADVMAQLRTEACARGVTINALAASILEAALLGAETPAELRASGAQGSSPEDANDATEVPF